MIADTVRVEPTVDTHVPGYLERPERPHEPLPNIISWLCWILGFIASLFGTLSVLHAEKDFPWLGFLFYVVGGVAISFGTFLAKSPVSPAALGWAIVTFVFCLFGGVYGSLISMIVYLLSRGQPKDTPLVDVVRAEMWIQSNAPPERDFSAPLEVQFREEIRTEPIVDMIPYADVATALAIIDRLAESTDPRQRRLLNRMSEDQRPEVFQYAMAKINELQRNYVVRIYQMTEQLRYRTETAALQANLAALYNEYMKSGLMEEGLGPYYWELAVAHTLEAMAADPKNLKLPVLLASLFRDRGLHKESLTVLESCMSRHPGDLGSLLLYLEDLFEEGQKNDRINFVRAVRKRALESGWAVKLPRKREGHAISELAHFWLGVRDNA